MAGLKFSAWTSATNGEVALSTGAQDIVLLLVAPANQGVIVRAWGLFLDGTTSTASPILVRLIQKTSTAPAGGVAGNKSNRDMSSSMTVQTTVTSENAAGSSFSTQGTNGDVYARGEIHPQMGNGEFWPLGEHILIEPAGMLAITALAGAAVNAVAGFLCEE